MFCVKSVCSAVLGEFMYCVGHETKQANQVLKKVIWTYINMKYVNIFT